MSQPLPEQQRRTVGAGPSAGGCSHCGEPCRDASFSLAGRRFCCLGCQTVYTLLQDHGLARFYELDERPGVRVRGTGLVSRWQYLDDPVVREKLLDYSDPSQSRITLHLPAIHCIACVWLLENLFKLHPGIGRSQVNFTRREAAIVFAPDRIKLSGLAALLTSLGYEPELTFGALEKSPGASGSRKAWFQIGVAGFAFGNIMLMSLPVYFGLDSLSSPWFKALAGWLGLLFALPVVTYSAADFWRAAWLGFRQRRLTIEVPIALGLATIYGASVLEVFSGRGPGYCDSLCGLIFFLLCGRWFQKRTYERLTFDRDYKGFFPLSVVRKTSAGEETVAISQLVPGDNLVLRHGELLPADAKLIRGEAFIDYGFVTGESEPVVCPQGSHLYAGGRQVGGAIEVGIIKPVAQSYLATLWNSETFRKRRDHDLDSLTNRYSRRFTRLIIGVALAAAVFWWVMDASRSLKAFTSVLIVACPCALALAAPLTHGTAQRILARIKVFLKNAQVLEHMAEVDTIVLDKTGTLTVADARGGRFQGAGVAARPPDLTAEESRWIASLARHSTHPGSVRVARMLPAAEMPVTGFQEVSGCGIAGGVAGHGLRLGSRAWLEQGGILVPPDASGAESGSRVCVAFDGRFRGAFTLENSLRPEVAGLITRLGGRFDLALLSGDNERDAARFRGIFGEGATLRFNQSPADKLNFIRDLQREGRKVMMVGDGLNDAGALRQAEVGVAVVERIGVFSPASDVILDAAELPRLAQVLHYARRAAGIVRAGFVISACYNVVGVGIAAAGLLSPVVCAILMPLSSVTVVAFTCGAAAWCGRALDAGAKPAPGETQPVVPRCRFDYSFTAREAA